MLLICYLVAQRFALFFMSYVLLFYVGKRRFVEYSGLEPLTSTLPVLRSSQMS